MKPVFADTFYWAALTSADDSFHDRAVEFSLSLQPEKIITTDEVLDEYLAFFSGAASYLRIRAGNTVDHLLNNSGVLVIPQSRGAFVAGLQLYRDRPDKGYSLTDCISMNIMRREGLNDILTNDHHFEQEGFRVLFREE